MKSVFTIQSLMLLSAASANTKMISFDLNQVPTDHKVTLKAAAGDANDNGEETRPSALLEMT